MSSWEESQPNARDRRLRWRPSRRSLARRSLGLNMSGVSVACWFAAKQKTRTHYPTRSGDRPQFATGKSHVRWQRAGRPWTAKADDVEDQFTDSIARMSTLRMRTALIADIEEPRGADLIQCPQGTQVSRWPHQPCWRGSARAAWLLGRRS